MVGNENSYQVGMRMAVWFLRVIGELFVRLRCAKKGKQIETNKI